MSVISFLGSLFCSFYLFFCANTNCPNYYSFIIKLGFWSISIPKSCSFSQNYLSYPWSFLCSPKYILESAYQLLWKKVGIFALNRIQFWMHQEITDILTILSLLNHSIFCIPTVSDDNNLGQIYDQLKCCNQGLLINASVSIQRKVLTVSLQDSVLGPVLWKKMSISYSDDTNLVGRARCHRQSKFRMISILEWMAEAKKIKFNKYKCDAQQQSLKFTLNKCRMVAEGVAIWQQFMWKGFGSTREAVG